MDYSEDLSNIITLNDENGDEVNFEFLDLIEYGGGHYVVLLPCDDDEDDGQVVILQLDESEEEESYISVDDENVLNAVFAIFKEKFKDDFNFE